MNTINIGNKSGNFKPHPLVSTKPRLIRTTPRFVTSSEFVNEFVAPDYLIEGLALKRFFYSLTGQTGSGKTAIALLLAKIVASGDKLGPRQTERGNVLYLAGENPDDVRMRWNLMADKLGFDPAKISVHFLDGAYPIDDLKPIIRKKAEELGGVALVLVDTSAAYFPNDTDENSNPAMLRYARTLRELTTLVGGPSVLALSHPMKSAKGKGTLLPRGGGAFLNETDGNFVVYKQRDGELHILHWSAKLRGPDFQPLAFRYKVDTTPANRDSKGRLVASVYAEHVADVSVQTLQSKNDAEELLVALYDSPKVNSLQEAAIAAGWGNDAAAKGKANRAIKRLRADGHVEPDSYSLTDKGQIAAKAIQAEDAEIVPELELEEAA